MSQLTNDDDLDHNHEAEVADAESEVVKFSAVVAPKTGLARTTFDLVRGEWAAESDQ